MILYDCWFGRRELCGNDEWGDGSSQLGDRRSAGDSSCYVCAFQGITTGWADWYFKQLSGQWIDITGVPQGDYIVHVEINAAHTFDEGANRYSNVIETTIHVPDPRNKVTVDNSPAATD